MNEKTILSFTDVSFNNDLKNISFELKRGDDLLIYSSNPNISSAFRDLLVFKNKKYTGTIVVGNSLLQKKSKDFFIPEKVLTVFSNKYKTHYYDKTLFEVLKYSFNTNDHIFKLVNDFRKDWKEVSDEYSFYIKEEEQKYILSKYQKQIEIYELFLGLEEFAKISSPNFECSKNLEFIDSYLDLRIQSLNESLNNITNNEIKQLNIYLEFQNKYRKQEGWIQDLKSNYTEAKKEVENFCNTSEFQINFLSRQEKIDKLEKELQEQKDFLKHGTLTNGIFDSLIKTLKDKWKNAVAERKMLSKKHNQEEYSKAKVNAWVKRKSYSFFKSQKRNFKYISANSLRLIYFALIDFEYQVFHSVFFDFKRGKRHTWHDEISIFESIKGKRFSIQKIKKDNEEKLKLSKSLINKIKKELSHLKKEKIEGSKAIDETERNIKINQFWEKQAEYIWVKEHKTSEIDIDNSKETDLYELEQKIISYIIKITKIDRSIYGLLESDKKGKIVLSDSLKTKIKTMMFLSKQSYAIYHPISFIYTSDFDDNKIIKNIIIKNELYNFLEKINIHYEKLWQPYKELTQAEKIKIDIAKLKLYEPAIAVIDLDKTLFDGSYIDELIKWKSPNTSLILFANKPINSSVNNIIFIDKGKILESTFANKKMSFESEYAKEFMETGNFNSDYKNRITLLDYEEIYNVRKNIQINNSIVYFSENELAVSKIKQRKEVEKEVQETNFIEIQDTIIIDLTEKKRRLKNG
ncbi:hypothetical protein [Mycoplasma procyoni]|uniref:hypothetical protein n=1 Tax=Mycoplasma procyoni TaxID=568784 RepID=UPI00197B814E|nr:hypothetical protein [Mycoplasma procyoni]MBN3535060.1 hypothetical protein [Mycoplasma procyoni]